MIQIIHVQDSGFLVLLNIFLYCILAVLAWKYITTRKSNIDSHLLISLNKKLDDLDNKLTDAQERIDTISIKVGMSARFINEKSDNNKIR
jgi:hypothetical protein